MTVHHITSGRADLNLGKAINDIIEFLPEEDWICLRDIDTMPLHHREFFKQCENIAKENKYDLVSCITNRLSVGYQLHNGKMSEDFDIKNHIEIAKERFNEFGSEVVDSPNNIAGVMMLFSKKTWENVGRFREGGVMVNGSFLDASFSESVKKIGGKIGVAKGIYIFHIYRDWVNENIRFANKHLVK